MTALHAFAQQILAERKCLTIPPVEVTRGGRRMIKHRGGKFLFESAVLEKRTGDIIPDVVVRKGDIELIVEMFVAHRCSEEKIAKFAALDVSALEIDLSGLPRDPLPSQIENAILHEAPREWRFNRHHDAMSKQLEKKAKEEVQRREERRAKAAAARKDDYALDLKSAHDKPPFEPWNPFRWDSNELRAALAAEALGEGYFAVHPSHWKFGVVSRLENGFDVLSLARTMQESGLVHNRWKPTRNGRRGNEDAGLPLDPAAVLEAFLARLASAGIAQQNEWGQWTLARAYRDRIVSQEQKAAADERERVDRERRIEELRKIATRAAELGDAGSSFDFDAWQSQPLDDQSPYQTAEAGGLSWFKLQRALAHLIGVLERKEPPPVTSFGIPVDVRLAEIQAEHDAKIEEQRTRRSQEIEQQFEPLRAHRPTWLDDLHPDLKGSTPRQRARASDEGYWHVLDLIEALRSKVPWEQKVIDELEERLGGTKMGPACRQPAVHENSRRNVANPVCSIPQNAENRP
jgi:hypothetical protein